MRDEDLRQLELLCEAVGAYFAVTGVGQAGSWENAFRVVRKDDEQARAFLGDLRQLIQYIGRLSSEERDRRAGPDADEEDEPPDQDRDAASDAPDADDWTPTPEPMSTSVPNLRVLATVSAPLPVMPPRPSAAAPPSTRSTTLPGPPPRSTTLPGAPAPRIDTPAPPPAAARRVTPSPVPPGRPATSPTPPPPRDEVDDIFDSFDLGSIPSRDPAADPHVASGEPADATTADLVGGQELRDSGRRKLGSAPPAAASEAAPPKRKTGANRQVREPDSEVDFIGPQTPQASDEEPTVIRKLSDVEMADARRPSLVGPLRVPATVRKFIDDTATRIGPAPTREELEGPADKPAKAAAPEPPAPATPPKGPAPSPAGPPKKPRS